ncbi:hypothetical protein BSKO_00171 [Bryopsis sp. KO-2023]|nr:hypothetical protein BSKO_00171 [Bryopsis sp. KO-2023]
MADAGVREVPDAVDILSSLASLGITEDLKEKISTTLSELTHLQNVQTQAPNKGAKQVQKQRNVHRLPQSYREAALEKKIEALQNRLDMSRSIMRKLYRKQVHLEKELNIMKANDKKELLDAKISHPAGASVASDVWDIKNEAKPPLDPNHVISQGKASNPQMDETVARLHAALNASRRRGALLEANLVDISQGANSTKSDVRLEEAKAQAVLYKQLYERAKNEVRKSLNRKAESLRSAAAASREAKGLIKDLQTRLGHERDEREAEAALYSSQLYDLEKERTDWYVDKKLLEQRIHELSEESKKREFDDIDIEACIAALLDRLRLAETSQSGSCPIDAPQEGQNSSSPTARAKYFDTCCDQIECGESDYSQEFDALVD